MYTPYLLSGYASALLLLLFGLRVIQGSTPELRGARQVNWFVLCTLGGLLFFALHPRLPFISVLGTNALTFAGGIFIYLATARVQQCKPALLPWHIGLSLAALAAQVWLSVVQSSLAARLMLHCTVMAVIYATSAAMIYRHSDISLSMPRRAAAAVSTVLAAYQILWGLVSLAHPPAVDFPQVDTLQTGLSYMAMVLACANVAALMWLSICVHRRDLHRIAQTDSLTGLLNRRAFEEVLRRELPRCDHGGRQIGAMLIDIDHFKRINDSLGHRAGDDALRRVAQALRERTRISDVLARFGGEEFVILLRDAASEECEAIAERIRTGIAELAGLPGESRLTVSIGVAISRAGETPDEFLFRCDQAMYGAKRNGRNLVVVNRTAGSEPVAAH